MNKSKRGLQQYAKKERGRVVYIKTRTIIIICDNVYNIFFLHTRTSSISFSIYYN